MRCHDVFPAKDMPEPVGCCSTFAVMRGLAEDTARKNFNTVLFLMKRFNKI
jgi:hypothetical protein